MKLVNSIIISYMNFHICITKFITAIQTNKSTRKTSLCNLLKRLIFAEIFLSSQTLSAEYRLVTTLCARYTIKISQILGLQRVLLSTNTWRPPMFNTAKHPLTGKVPAERTSKQQHSVTLRAEGWRSGKGISREFQYLAIHLSRTGQFLCTPPSPSWTREIRGIIQLQQQPKHFLNFSGMCVACGCVTNNTMTCWKLEAPVAVVSGLQYLALNMHSAIWQTVPWTGATGRSSATLLRWPTFHRLLRHKFFVIW